MAFLTLDGTVYRLGIKSLRRNFAIEEGGNGIQVKTGKNVRDIIGTRYSYTLEVDARISHPADYDAFYEAISAPVTSHIITVPYGQSTLTFEADVEGGEDTLLDPTTTRRWGELTVDFIAKEPQRKG